MGLYVPSEYGGQGLSQTGYCRVSEEFAQIDPTLSVIMGVHQSIGMKGIVLFGSDEQKERYLPDLASGRKLAAFALTEPNAGSDVYNMESRAVLQPDGSWKLNGHKRYIGNGSKAGVIVTFARAEVDGKDRHIALILEPDMDGLRGRRPLRHDGPARERPAPAPLQRHPRAGRERARRARRRLPDRDADPQQRAAVARHGVGRRRRSGSSTGSSSTSRSASSSACRSPTSSSCRRRSAGWSSFTFGLESTAYMTTALVDTGVPDYSLESAICKVAGTEFLWYAANRALQLNGGQGYMRDEPYEKMLRDIRIFPIFEGANDVMRAFIALSGDQAAVEELKELGDISLGDPIESLGVLADYVGGADAPRSR